jgi:hypothetical protein
MDSDVLRRAVVLTILVVGACNTPPGDPRANAAPPTTTSLAPTATDIPWFPPTETPAAALLATLEPTPERKPGVGSIIYEDDLHSGADWNRPVSDAAAVSASDRGLTVAAEPGLAPVVSILQGSVFADMYAEITARPSLCREADTFGLLFRAPNDVAYYRFAVACNGTANAERISLGTTRLLQPATPSADVPVGAPGEVRLGLWALGSEFRFFLNGRYQFTASDKSYSSGGIGVFAHAGGETPVVVTFSDLAVRSVADDSANQTPSP